MKTRNWSIRSKIIALVAVPISALLALWIFATALTLGPALNLLTFQTLLDKVGEPGEVVVAELRQERRLSVVLLSGGGDKTPLDVQRIATNSAIKTFRASAGGAEAQDAASGPLRTRITQAFAAFDGLDAGRSFIDSREVDPVGAQNLFSSMIDSVFGTFAGTVSFEDAELDREIRALTTLGSAMEWLSRVDSLLAGATAAGRFSAGGAGDLIQAIATQRYLYAQAIADLPEDERAAYQRLLTGDAYSRLEQLQDTLARSSRGGGTVSVKADQWQPAYDSTVQQLSAFGINATEALNGRAEPVAIGTLIRLGLAGVLGLTAVIVSTVVSVRVGRSLISRLRGLRAVALDLAGERLPAVVLRLRHGDTVDVESETPPLEFGTDEIGELGRAFTEVQRTAVQSAVDEAAVRRGINEVFLNIARRSQTLLHRQLSLLDRMERRETDSQELEDLYRVDHLATRMRRHAEDLVILAGAAPGRGWRNPVPLIDVIRGAISEVEDYKRIDISAVEASSAAGRAVGDIIHLLAELLENAASFSPPHARVQVAGQLVPNGYAVEIEDRGLGMSYDALAEANRRLAEPPDFDPAESARLGLFVVALLANRHGIRVQLRASPYGGVTAVALIPTELITEGGPMALPAGPSGSRSERSAALAWERSPAGPADGPTRPTPAVAGRNGSSGAGPLVSGVPDRVSPAPAEAAPSAGATEGLTADGLAQRRRTVPRPRTGSPEAPRTAEHEPTRMAQDAPTLAGLPIVGLPVPGTPARGPSERPGPMPGRVAPIVGDDGLPRRVRQASLTPQLREPVLEQEDPTPRSPEEVRSLMSALQVGTTRGRIDALGAVTAPAAPSSDETTDAPAAPPVAGEAPSVAGDQADRTAATTVPDPQESVGVTPAQDAASAAPVGADETVPTVWSADVPAGTGPTPGTTWADAATAGYPLTRDAAGAAADAAAVVHYGEIVPRGVPGRGADPPSPPQPIAHPDGEQTQLEKDA